MILKIKFSLFLITILLFTSCQKPNILETKIVKNRFRTPLPTSCDANTIIYGKLQPVRTAEGKLYNYYIMQGQVQTYLGDIRKEELLNKMVFAIAKSSEIQFQHIGGLLNPNGSSSGSSSNSFMKNAKVGLIEADDKKNLENIKKVCNKL